MSTVVVGEKEYQIVKTGRAQAEQVLGITRWIAQHGVPVINGLRNEQDEIVVDESSWLNIFIQILEKLTPDALLDLFQVLVGCSKEDTELYFDVATLIEVALTVYNEQPSVRRLVERFFSESSSPVLPGSAEFSMISEQPTDGQMTQS